MKTFKLWLERFEDIQFQNIHEDTHGRPAQHDYTLGAFNGKPQSDYSNVLGYLQYSLMEDEVDDNDNATAVHMNYIFTGEKFRNEGVARALMDELHRMYPEATIHRGLSTDLGAEFFRRYDEV